MIHPLNNSKCRMRARLERLESRCLMANIASDIELLSAWAIHGTGHLELSDLEHASTNPWEVNTIPSNVDMDEPNSPLESIETQQEEVTSESIESRVEASTPNSGDVSDVAIASSGNAPSTHPSSSQGSHQVTLPTGAVTGIPPILATGDSATDFHGHLATGTAGANSQGTFVTTGDSPMHLHGNGIAAGEGVIEIHWAAGSHFQAQDSNAEVSETRSSQTQLGMQSHDTQVVVEESDFQSQEPAASLMSEEMSMADEAFSSDPEWLLAQWTSDEQNEPQPSHMPEPKQRIFPVVLISGSHKISLETPLKVDSLDELLATEQRPVEIPSRSLAFGMVASLSIYLAIRFEKKAQATLRLEARRPSYQIAGSI